MLRFETAGESHGELLVATLTGLPAGIPVSFDYLNRQLWRRQQGYGRGGRMKIETDRVRVVSGVRLSMTTGSPIAILIENKDWKNWSNILAVEAAHAEPGKEKLVHRPRPGHADLAGVIKYNFPDARHILERASARETTARVAVGAVAKTFLRQFGISSAMWWAWVRSVSSVWHPGMKLLPSASATTCCSAASILPPNHA